MKDITIEVTPQNCEDNLQTCFDEYIKKQNPVNLCNLIIKVAQNELYNLNLGKIELSFKRIFDWGNYYKNTIILNKKLLKKAKDSEYLIKSLDVIFHEIMHMKTEQNNNIAIENKNKELQYFHQYRMYHIWELLCEQCYDEETALAGSFYFYFKNVNEKISRKYAYRKTNEYLKKYCKEIRQLQSFEELEQELIGGAYKAHPMLRYNINTIQNYILDYQLKILNNIDEATTFQIEDFKHSLDIIQVPNINKQIVNACVNSSNLENIKLLLDTPLIRLTPKEYSIIKNTFSKIGENVEAYLCEKSDEKTIV